MASPTLDGLSFAEMGCWITEPLIPAVNWKSNCDGKTTVCVGCKALLAI